MGSCSRFTNLEDNWLRQEGKEFFWLKRKLGSLSLDRKRFITYRSKEHFFKKYQSFNFNYELINKLIALNVETIVLIYLKANNEKSVFKVSPKLVRERGIQVKESFYDIQLAVKLSLFEKSD